MKAKIFLFVIIILSPIIFYLWPSFLGGDSDFLTVHGISMLPTIQPGSFVITKNASSYQIDDIVSYPEPESPKKIIVHRIIERVDGGFIIKGDNNKEKDPGIISPTAIIGKVVFATPYFGYLIEFIRNPLVMTVISMSFLAVEVSKKKKDTALVEKSWKKKSDYKLFFPAIAINLITYVAIQISLELGISPRTDMLTSFLFRIFESSFASTLSFATYFIVIVGLYVMAKNYKPVSKKKSTTETQTVLVKESNYILLGAQIVWMMFTLMAIMSLVGMVQDIWSVIGHEEFPTEEIDRFER